jgi:hypothetical protein
MAGPKNFPALFSLHHLPGIDCFAALAMTGRRPQEANAQVPEPWSDPGPLSVIASDRRERGDLCVKRQGGVVGPGYFPEVGSPHRLPDRAPSAALAMTRGMSEEAVRPRLRKRHLFCAGCPPTVWRAVSRCSALAEPAVTERAAGEFRSSAICRSLAED